jgi:hypothetical protein
MSPELKKRWLDALRSGKYRQGKFRLKDVVKGQTCHCCLGVLAVEASSEIRSAGATLEIAETFIEIGSGNGYVNTIQFSGMILETLGMSADDQNELVRINDLSSNYYEQILYIEKNL